MNSNTLASNSRIEILDGFRCIAVMAVVSFHYFYSFSILLKDYSDYPSWYFLAYGYFGVHLFFMISGFVIYRSLEQSTNVKEFLAKRYIRLAPTLILGSIITYSMFTWWNTSERIQIYGVTSPADFLFSFTFVHPEIWNFLLGRDNIEYIDGAYWSLWVEVVFYVLASILYFSSRKGNFLRNWFILVFTLTVLRIITSPKVDGFMPEFMLPLTSAYYRAFIFMNIHQWVYFSIGILFYSIWMKRTPPRFVWIMVSFLVLLEIYFITSNGVRVLFPLAIGLWFVFVHRPAWLRFLQWRPVQMIGLISYPLYVLHESAGFVLSEKLIEWTDHSVPVALLLVVVLVVFILLAYFVFVVFEKPVTRALKAKLLGIE